jgi:enoyl-CoA hydratase/carnithine racemase
MHRELSAVWDDFAADPDCWVAILTGAGERAFSAGNDLKHAAAHPEEIGRDDLMPRGGFGGIVARFDLFKPIIAAVNGYALGGGLEIALACDIIVASETARFGLPEPRVGDIANGGGITRLSRQIPLKQAMSLVLTGRRIDAGEALRLGFVNEVVPPDQLRPAAERWANEILEAAPLAVRASKEVAMVGLDHDVATAMRLKYANFEALLASEDAIEGPTAFAEKRPPKWTGR